MFSSWLQIVLPGRVVQILCMLHSWCNLYKRVCQRHELLCIALLNHWVDLLDKIVFCFRPPSQPNGLHASRLWGYMDFCVVQECWRTEQAKR